MALSKGVGIVANGGTLPRFMLCVDQKFSFPIMIRTNFKVRNKARRTLSNHGFYETPGFIRNGSFIKAAAFQPQRHSGTNPPATLRSLSLSTTSSNFKAIKKP